MLCIYEALVGGMLTYVVGVDKEERKSKQTRDGVVLKPRIYGG
jgi:hypothetical protein